MNVLSLVSRWAVKIKDGEVVFAVVKGMIIFVFMHSSVT